MKYDDGMKTIVITGATSGIGLAAADILTRQGYFVIGIGRDEDKCRIVQEQLNGAGTNVRAVFFTADLMQQREVNRIADLVSGYLAKHCGGELHALINNAGCVRSWFTATEEGYEQQFSLNHLAGFLLTYRLFPFIKKAGGRIIMTGSRSHKGARMHWDDVMLRRRYNPLSAYKQSKLCNVLFAKGLNDRYSASGIRAYTVDPGLVKTDIGNKQTGAVVGLVWKIRKKSGVPPAIPAQNYAFLCGQQPAPEDLYYYKCRAGKFSRQVTSKNADRLFELSQRLCGVRYGSTDDML